MKRVILLALVIFVVTGATAGAGALITGKQIKNGSIGTADLSSKAKRALKGNTGPRGPQGPQGTPGAQGAAGPATFANVQAIESAPVSVPPGSFSSPDAYCPAGKVVIGTGYYAGLAYADFVKSYGTFVGAFFSNDASINTSVHVQAICANASSGVAVAASMSKAREQFRKDVARARAAR
jgi:hypothetical protein